MGSYVLGFWKKLKGMFQGDKKVTAIVVLGVIGIVLIASSSFFSKNEKNKQQQTSETGANLSNDEYAAAVEKKLTEILGSIEGVGDVKVMVTVESSAEYVYAKEEKTTTDSTKDYDGETAKKFQEKNSTDQTYLLVDSPTGKRQALLVSVVEPKIQGVIVACQGADNKIVEEKVVRAVTTAFHINSNRVCIARLA